MSKPRKNRKGKGRPARPPRQVAARKQLRDALEAVEGLKGLTTLTEAGPLLQMVHDTVVGLAPIMDALIEDHESLNHEVEALKQVCWTLTCDMADENPAKASLQERLGPLMANPDEESDSQPHPHADP